MGSGEAAESATSLAINFATAAATSLVVPELSDRAHLENASGQAPGEAGAEPAIDGFSPDAEFDIPASPFATFQAAAAHFPPGVLPDIHLSDHERDTSAPLLAPTSADSFDGGHNNINNGVSSDNPQSPVEEVEACDMYETSGPQRPSQQPTPNRYRKISVIVPNSSHATSTAAGTISKRRGVSVSGQPTGLLTGAGELSLQPPPNSLAVGDYLQASLSSLNSNSSYNSSRSGSTSGKREQYAK